VPGVIVQTLSTSFVVLNPLLAMSGWAEPAVDAVIVPAVPPEPSMSRVAGVYVDDVPISKTLADRSPVLKFISRFPTTWPLVRLTFPDDPMLTLLELVVTFPLDSVNVPLTVALPALRVSPLELLTLRFPYVKALSV